MERLSLLCLFLCLLLPSARNIQGSDPAVYQLRGSKSSNISVCLFTDFDSSLSVTKTSEPSVFFTDKTAVDMKAIGSRSNGALAWSNNKNFACNETFNEGSFYSSSGIVCDAKLMEKSFETDMNLNFQNLSVIRLRILLLKVVAFNLLMTLQLWSS